MEIGTRQSTLPVVVSPFGSTPHIAHSGVFLALRASECNGWPAGGLRANGAIAAQVESAVFRRNTRVVVPEGHAGQILASLDKNVRAPVTRANNVGKM